MLQLGMFELPVVLWMFILSQVFGAINIAISLIKQQFSNKSRALRWSAAGNVFKVLNYAFILNWSLAGIKLTSIAKNLIFAKRSKRQESGELEKCADSEKRKEFWKGLFALIFFCAVSTVVVVISWIYSGLWFEWVILGVVIFSNIGKWARGIHILRVSALVYRVTMIFNSIFFFFNPMNIIKAILTIISIFVFYIRFWRGKIKRAKNEIIEPTDLGNNAEITK